MAEGKTTDNGLKLFEPLKEYFKILNQNNCDNYENCEDLMNILSSEDCDTDKGVISKNFLDALTSFAYELRQADTPIGVVTIKDRLRDIFDEQLRNVNNLSDKNTFIKGVVDAVNEAKDLNGFNMNQKTGGTFDNTYEENLSNTWNDVVKNPSLSMDEKKKFFDYWITNSFELYYKNEEYFKNNIEPQLDKLDVLEKKLLDEFFEIKDNANTTYTIDNYTDAEKQGKNFRLNVKILNGTPLLLKLLPEKVRDAFKQALITPTENNVVFVLDNDCKAKVEKTNKKPEEKTFKIEPKDSPKVLEWFKQQAISLLRRIEQPEIVDAEDNEPYKDDSTTIDFKSIFNSVKDHWRVDLSGKLYKKDGSGNFVEYSDKEYEEDANKFKNNEGHCGNLCIFDTPDKCKEFFERMMKQDNYSIEDLSKVINDEGFVKSYKELQENIANVNPLFVIRTLRMFGFDKYDVLNNDGTKSVKMESFTRWWNRHSGRLSSKLNSKKPRQGLIPPPPENLELFFKLLINFINDNSFILNPQSKEIVTNSKDLKVRGKTKYFEPRETKLESSDPTSFSELRDFMNKSAAMRLKPANMGLPENRIDLPLLLNLMMAVTTGGKIILSDRLFNKYPSRSGTGYIVGGGDQGSSQIPQLTAEIQQIYKIGLDKLKSKGKDLAESSKVKIKNEIEELLKAEKSLLGSLTVLAKYVEVINILNDEVKNSNITEEIMEKAILEYEKKSKEVPAKRDSILSHIQKLLYSNSSGYTPL